MEELIKLVIVLVVLVGPWLVRTLLSQQNQAGQAPKRPMRPLERDVIFEAKRAEQAKPLQNEIDEFLRRAGERQNRGARPKPPPPKQAKRPPADAPVLARPVSVAEQVQKDLDSSEFARRSGSLGDQLIQAEEKTAERLHDTFDHQVGQFATSRTDGAAAPMPQPSLDLSAVVAALSNPESIRTAIILNEILQRPTHRW